MFKKLALGLIIAVLVIFSVGAWYIVSAPDIPSNADEIIETANAMPLPDFYQGQEFYASNGDISLWYELNKSTIQKKGTVILIMGYGSSSMQWPPYFFQSFQDEGYDVIRFDHRDIGKSSWLDSWTEANAYTLEDIADDVKAILDDASVSKAHIVGMSMGGMIAQSFAINYPDETLSLTSMSSTGYFADPDLPGIFPETLKDITRYTAKYAMDDSPKTSMKFNLTASNLFKGNYELDNINTVLKTRYELERRNGFNPNAGKHHETAITKSGSRYEDLAKLSVPSLILHGRVDPLVPFEHGQKTAELIPNAQTFYLDDLGHDIPKHLAPQMSNAILDLINAVYESEVLDGEELLSSH